MSHVNGWGELYQDEFGVHIPLTFHDARPVEITIDPDEASDMFRGGLAVIKAYRPPLADDRMNGVDYVEDNRDVA